MILFAVNSLVRTWSEAPNLWRDSKWISVTGIRLSVSQRETLKLNPIGGSNE